MVNEPMTKLDIAELIEEGLDLDCGAIHLDELNLDKLAPLETVRHFSPTDLDDLDWRANAIAYGWHGEAETAENVMALARAVPRLTAELRRLRCS